MQRCFPDPLDSPDDDTLAAAYAWPTTVDAHPVVRANMVASIDGGTTVDGSSAALGSPGDRRLFTILRDLSDVLLVGAGTIRAEGYGAIRLDRHRLDRRRRWGLGGPPPVAVVSATGLSAELDLFTDAEPTPIVLTTTAGAARMAGYPARIIDVSAVDAHRVDLRVMVDLLAELGLRRVLCEGGPGLLRNLLAADLVDELCLTTTFELLGAAAGPLLGPSPLPHPVSWRLSVLHLDEINAFTLYRKASG